MLHKKDLTRIKEICYCVAEDKPVDRSDIVKGYEVSEGEYVVFEDEELKKTAPRTANTMEVLQFVGSDEVDPLFLENSYYIAPEEKVSKPYALFLAALSDTERDAIAQLVMHNREHVVLIRASEGTLVLHTLYYANELHKANTARVPEEKFHGEGTGHGQDSGGASGGALRPDQFHDTYRENVERMIQEKQKGEKITVVKQARKELPSSI